MRSCRIALGAAFQLLKCQNARQHSQHKDSSLGLAGAKRHQGWARAEACQDPNLRRTPSLLHKAFVNGG